MSMVQFLPKKGSRIVVVGGSGGMGRALVRAALSHGLKVVILGRGHSFEQYPAPEGALTIPCDVTDELSVNNAFQTIDKQWGAIDGLVNLAGYTGEAIPIKNLTANEWDSVGAVGLRGTFLVCRAALPLLEKGESSSVVLISSTFGHRVVFSGYAHYASAKAGVVALGKALASESSPSIRVNVVSPGVFNTAFLQGGTGREKLKGSEGVDSSKYHSLVPLGRIGEPDEMAGPILFLLGPAASYITGQVLHVNGGTWAP